MTKEQFKQLLTGFASKLLGHENTEGFADDFIKNNDINHILESDPAPKPDKLTLMDQNDFENLKYGDKVYELWTTQKTFIELYYIGRLPINSNCLVFCENDYTTTFYLEDNEFLNNTWYFGKSDIKAQGTIILEKLNKSIESVKKVYFK